MNRGLLIIGAGGHGKVVADTARQQGQWDKFAFLDDDTTRSGNIVGIPVLGDFRTATRLRRDYTDAVVAIGNAVLRLRLIAEMADQGFNLPVIQHPSAAISSFASLRDGCVVFAQAAINADATLGLGCIVNTGSTVDHDCRLADGVHLAPGAHLAGGVHIGHSSWIGIGACVRENTNVGDRVTVGAGAAVVADVESGLTVLGVPASAAQGSINRS